jgi:hypothetical protein
MKMKEMLMAWLARRLLTCQEVTRMASEAMERKLPLRQRIDMKLHFLICALCLRYFKQLQFMREIARQRAAQAEDAASSTATSLSSEARERMKRRLGMFS